MFRQLYSILYGRILEGPFAGMKYPSLSVGSCYWPKVFGVYEKDLIELVQSFSRHSYDLVVNVGAAEGYYAIGIKRMMPNTRLLAYEATEKGRKVLAKVAKRNSCTIEIQGECSYQDLEPIVTKKNCLLIMDVEGFEAELLVKNPIDIYENSSILVEVHDQFVADVGKQIAQKFQDTHEIKTIIFNQVQEADSFIFKGLQRINKSRAKALLFDARDQNCYWYWMTPKKV